MIYEPLKDRRYGKNREKGRQTPEEKDVARMLWELFQGHPDEVFDIKRIFKELKLETHPAKLLCMDLLDDMVKDDHIKRSRACISS